MVSAGGVVIGKGWGMHRSTVQGNGERLAAQDRSFTFSGVRVQRMVYCSMQQTEAFLISQIIHPYRTQFRRVADKQSRLRTSSPPPC